jgi:hypothetical protein
MAGEKAGGTTHGLTPDQYASALDGGSEADLWAAGLVAPVTEPGTADEPDLTHEPNFLMPAGYFEDDRVKFSVGVAAFVAESNSDNPDQGRLTALQGYLGKYGPLAARMEQQEASRAVEGTYPE